MRLTETQFMSIWRCLYPDSRSGRIRSGLGQSLPASGMGAPAYHVQGQGGQSGSSRAIVARADERSTAMIALKRLALVVGLVASPLVGHAEQICDYEGKCYPAEAPHQTYHMDPSNPDLETPPPAPQYPAPSAPRDIVVRPSASEGCHLYKIRSVPNIEPQIVEICSIPPDEERAIRERANSSAGADIGQPAQ
jgi:hypothetical protein